MGHIGGPRFEARQAPADHFRRHPPDDHRRHGVGPREQEEDRVSPAEVHPDVAKVPSRQGA